MHFREHFFPIGEKKILFRALYEYKTLKYVKSIQFMGLNKRNAIFKLCFTSKENQGLMITANNINSSTCSQYSLQHDFVQKIIEHMLWGYLCAQRVNYSEV